jgi:putative NIF3 family GTP cyclohydrolase 1 type 2
MNLDELVTRLDLEFGIASHSEDLVEWAVTPENCTFVHPDFLHHSSALMTHTPGVINTVCTSVFVTENIVRQLVRRPHSLLLTHHHFNYFEDGRGLQPIPPEWLQMLREIGVSIYVAHAPLDTHRTYGTSRALAELVGTSVTLAFYDYFGAPAALVTEIPRTTFAEFAETVQGKLRRPFLTLHPHRPYAERIAVVAGGGDLPDLLQQAFDVGCDTLLTGTIENRWQIPSVQDANRKFHVLNADLHLNLIGGTHFGTERPAMVRLVELFRSWGMHAEYLEDENLLSAA